MNHSFSVSLATELQHVEKAIIIENLSFWIDKNKANRKHLHNGKYWTYNTAQAFSELFPYMNPNSIQKWLKQLKDDGYILSENFNDNSYDRTKWYTLTNKAYKHLRPFVKNTNGNVETTNPSDQNDESTTTDIKQDINTDTPPAPKGESKSISIDSLTEEQKDQWRRFKQVCADNNISIIFELQDPLTPRELFALKDKYRPDEILDTIKALQNYKQAKKKYTSANLTLQRWLKRSA